MGGEGKQTVRCWSSRLRGLTSEGGHGAQGEHARKPAAPVLTGQRLTGSSPSIVHVCIQFGTITLILRHMAPLVCPHKLDGTVCRGSGTVSTRVHILERGYPAVPLVHCNIQCNNQTSSPVPDRVNPCNCLLAPGKFSLCARARQLCRVARAVVSPAPSLWKDPGCQVCRPAAARGTTKRSPRKDAWGCWQPASSYRCLALTEHHSPPLRRPRRRDPFRRSL